MESIAKVGEAEILTVSQLTALVRQLIEGEFPSVWVTGEVSNYNRHSSGHIYFTLKDDRAQLRCVLFSNTARLQDFLPEDGLKVLAQGRLTVYERAGQYELIVNTMMPAGRGELYIAFNLLKEKLSKEGLFDKARKKPLPRFPRRLAVITSPTGAAIRDVIRVATNIHSGIAIVVVPVKVQGEGAKDEIAEAIDYVNTIGGFDVILVTRGGGSIEDLWAFNEEVVARAISRSRIPVVSAVGHEIDTTIADLVADARAPTPSAAPTLILADYVDARARLESLVQRAATAIQTQIRRYGSTLETLRSHYGLRRMRDRVLDSIQDVDQMMLRADRAIGTMVQNLGARLESLMSRARALSPLATLERGYSICFGKDGHVVRSYKQIDVGDAVKIRFFEGFALSRVEKTAEELS